MKNVKSKRRSHATLRSRWWTSQISRIRFCFQCGGKLSMQFVREEACRRRVCVDCRCITYTNPKVVAGCVPVMPDGRVVLLQRDNEPGKGKWSFPAGYMELGESVDQAATRETWEEICVKVKIIRQLGVYSYSDAGAVTVVYVGQVLNGQIPKAGHESADIMLVHPRDIPWDKLGFRSIVDGLTDWVKATSKRKKT